MDDKSAWKRKSGQRPRIGRRMTAGALIALCSLLVDVRVQAIPIPTARVQLLGVSIDDSSNVSGLPGGNLNSSADPGETVKLKLRVKNVGTLALTQVTGTLQASYGGVPVASGTSSYVDLPMNASADPNTPFVVPIRQDYPKGARVSLELTIRRNGILVDHLWTSLLVGEFVGGSMRTWCKSASRNCGIRGSSRMETAFDSIIAWRRGRARRCDSSGWVRRANLDPLNRWRQKPACLML